MTDAKFETWGVLEIMGHVKFAGRISEEAVAGGSMVRIDVPASERWPAFSKLFGLGSVYSITPTSEEIARSQAAIFAKRPLQTLELPADQQARLPMAPPRADSEQYFEEDDEY